MNPLRTRSGLIAVGIVLGVVVVATALHATMSAPDGLDYSRSRNSAAGLYRMTFTPESDTIRVGRLHSWRLHLETTDGDAVDSAALTINGGMPQHGHGLPTRPRVTQALAGGDYLVEGMKFNMGGWWTVTFGVRGSEGTDSVTFNLRL